MQLLLLAVVMAVVAFVGFTRFRKSRNAGQRTKSNLWMVATIIAGLVGILSLVSFALQ